MCYIVSRIQRCYKVWALYSRHFSSSLVGERAGYTANNQMFVCIYVVGRTLALKDVHTGGPVTVLSYVAKRTWQNVIRGTDLEMGKLSLITHVGPT